MNVYFKVILVLQLTSPSRYSFFIWFLNVVINCGRSFRNVQHSWIHWWCKSFNSHMIINVLINCRRSFRNVHNNWIHWLFKSFNSHMIIMFSSTADDHFEMPNIVEYIGNVNHSIVTWSSIFSSTADDYFEIYKIVEYIDNANHSILTWSSMLSSIAYIYLIVNLIVQLTPGNRFSFPM
jgi:hypothetical protein